MLILPQYRTLTITGTRATKGVLREDMNALFNETLKPYNTRETSWFIGGAIGVDTYVLDWFVDNIDGTATIVVPKTVADQPMPARKSIDRALMFDNFSLIELKQIIFPASEAFHHRNRYMVNKSNATIGYPHKTQKSNGTRYTIDYTIDMGKQASIHPIG